jgi:hypothetical protein
MILQLKQHEEACISFASYSSGHGHITVQSVGLFFHPTIELARSTKMLADFHQNTKHYIPEDKNLHN